MSPSRLPRPAMALRLAIAATAVTLLALPALTPIAGAMLAVFTLFVARLLPRLNHMQPLAPDGILLALDAGEFLTLAVGGWFSGRRVYGHGVGSDRT